MGLFDALLGRSKPARPDLGHLFALSGAAVSLAAAENLESTERAGVCFKSIDAQAFAAAKDEFEGLLRLDNNEGGTGPESANDGVRLSESTDRFGYSWIVLEGSDFDTLVTRAHYVNSTLNDHGFGPQLLCSVFGFRPAGAPAGAGACAYLVYLFKQGTFYPFVPLPGEKRDNEMELRLKNELAEELHFEPQLDRWFPLWDLPL